MSKFRLSEWLGNRILSENRVVQGFLEVEESRRLVHRPQHHFFDTPNCPLATL